MTRDRLEMNRRDLRGNGAGSCNAQNRAVRKTVNSIFGTSITGACGSTSRCRFKTIFKGLRKHNVVLGGRNLEDSPARSAMMNSELGRSCPIRFQPAVGFPRAKSSTVVKLGCRGSVFGTSRDSVRFFFPASRRTAGRSSGP
jgi:hypothetical protein